jgi:NAD(P)-dependent dehydrogenase (short-subunit alcohol dehydrogenase family)
MQLSDKVIIVTGGNGLIGKSIVEHLISKGAIVINAEIGVRDDPATNTLECDITDPESVKELVKKVSERYKRIDGLVNNAYPRTSDWGNVFEDVSMESWRKNVEMQLNSCFFICQQVLAVMQKQGNGSVVNIASIYGVVGNDFTVYENTNGMTSPAAYSAIKGGIVNFTRYLAAYYGHLGIRVNCVSPGGIFNEQHPAFVEQFEKKVPLKRMGKPEEIAPAISFLLSDEASYITGHNLMVDGGWTAI